MPESSWPENDSYSELEPLGSLFVDLPDRPEVDSASSEPHKGDNRRRRAAIALVAIWSGTIGLHLVTWGYWVVIGLTALMGIQAARILFARPLSTPALLSSDSSDVLPLVSILVAAKNEEAVIARLVRTLCELDYPTSCYELWVIDDNSTDKTPTLLQQLSQQYKQLRVFYRPADAGGGKSGALNQVLPLTNGEIIAVFDADAQVSHDMLRRVLPLFQREALGAVQVRKAVSNGSENGWTRGQVAEMALDSFYQRQRIAIGGIGELRGNGQFVRREALERCGGWNEATITDDLDLTFRLHLDQWDVDFMALPAVEEEGVTQAISLWHQRSRWAEGGYQRYLDYWRPILQNRMGTRKTIDLLMFWIIQYLLPTAIVPDLLMSVLRNRPLLVSPLTTLTLALSVIGTVAGLRQIRSQTSPQLAQNAKYPSKRAQLSMQLVSSLRLLFHTVFGTLYMFHWLPVVAVTTARLSIRPKRLKWVKTIHQGE
ncbi:glycosyltransferase [Stenomitos frigidus]|uniref:Beta-monoglucosyldiacylglycerol synthase n=1 Tax=Stenomitos frigidus ULC18 TaxID=2107698 RepID=A0A2T1ED43_9CYAN|nr:glycosyltransferase family 2 protein [Stenomitos frigidus]PSB30669.1 glycosyl transferase [Stenomitos frigidus ULC18]